MLFPISPRKSLLFCMVGFKCVHFAHYGLNCAPSSWNLYVNSLRPQKGIAFANKALKRAHEVHSSLRWFLVQHNLHPSIKERTWTCGGMTESHRDTPSEASHFRGKRRRLRREGCQHRELGLQNSETASLRSASPFIHGIILHNLVKLVFLPNFFLVFETRPH